MQYIIDIKNTADIPEVLAFLEKKDTSFESLNKQVSNVVDNSTIFQKVFGIWKDEKVTSKTYRKKGSWVESVGVKNELSIK